MDLSRRSVNLKAGDRHTTRVPATRRPTSSPRLCPPAAGETHRRANPAPVSLRKDEPQITRPFDAETAALLAMPAANPCEKLRRLDGGGRALTSQCPLTMTGLHACNVQLTACHFLLL